MDYATVRCEALLLLSFEWVSFELSVPLPLHMYGTWYVPLASSMIVRGRRAYFELTAVLQYGIWNLTFMMIKFLASSSPRPRARP